MLTAHINDCPESILNTHFAHLYHLSEFEKLACFAIHQAVAGHGQNDL